MSVLSVRESLGGRWAGNPTGWLVLLLPSTLLVILQGSALGAPLVSSLGLSALEHVATGLLVVPTVWLAHRRWTVIPLPFMIVVWVAVGFARGLAWAWWQVSVQGGTADVGYCILVWVAISVVWSPLATYSMAQFDHRRVLLEELRAARVDRILQQARADQSDRARRAELVAMVQRTISPVIAELHRSVNAIATQLTEESASSLGARLSNVAYDTSRIVAGDSTPPSAATSALSRQAPFAAALNFPVERPIYASTISGLALMTLVVPDGLRLRGPDFALWALIAIVALALALALCLTLLRWARRRFGKVSGVLVIAGLFASGVIGSITLMFAPHSRGLQEIVALLVLLPFGSVFVGGVVSAAVGLTIANTDLVAQIGSLREEAEQLNERSAKAERRSRAQLAELLHGSVYGRLSACAMALNFHAEELAHGDYSRSDYVTNTVLEYLDAASRDLDALTLP